MRKTNEALSGPGSGEGQGRFGYPGRDAARSRALGTRLVATLIAGLAWATVAQPQDILSEELRTNGSALLEPLRAATASAARATVEILANGQRVSLGTVVSRSGYLIAKASELVDGPMMVRATRGRELAVELAGRDVGLDLALLKVEGLERTPIVWSALTGVALGQWVAAPAPRGRTQIGVVSATQRPIDRAGGALGIRLSPAGPESERGVAVVEVYPDSAAEAAGLAAGDVILAVDDEPTLSVDGLVERIKRRNPGDKARLHLLREGAELDFEVVLGYRSVFDVFDRNQRMSGATSKRRTGFLAVIQHTVPLSPTSLGGPLVDLDGEAVGINIARVDRVTTYALPASLVRPAIQTLLTAAGAASGE